MGDLFREGGPHRVRRIGDEQYEMKIKLPTDEDGRLGRECPSGDCEPAYFRVKLGTGITGTDYERSYCPYCRHDSDPNDFATAEQLQYGRQIAIDEAWGGVDRMVIDSLGLLSSRKRSIDCGLLSLEMSYKTTPRPTPRHPVEETLRRDVLCPHCGLDHSVYGLATWCPDCGNDVFLVHVEEEFAANRRLISSVNTAGDPRVQAKVMENALEDVVSIFEGTLKHVLRRMLRDQGKTREEVDQFVSKKVRNSLQNVTAGARVFQEVLGLPLFAPSRSQDQSRLQELFEKRHPITHNLGVIDRKYNANTGRTGREGRELDVTMGEVEEAFEIAFSVIATAYARLLRNRMSDGGASEGGGDKA